MNYYIDNNAFKSVNTFILILSIILSIFTNYYNFHLYI